MIFVAKKISYNSFVIREAHVFVSFTHWHAIVGNDSSSVDRKSSFERNEMIIKIIAWIYLPLLKRKMWVKSFLLWPATGKMFGHCGNTGWSKFIALEAENICFRHLRCEL